jgi:acyl transferase domain-containing protein
VVIVVKSLEDALRDKDHIYSVILGSSINSTGSRLPLNVPSSVAQKECIQKAYARAGRKLSDVDYAELHVTGTVTY